MGDCAIEVREFYNTYNPPRWVTRTVQKLVSSVPAEYVRGIDCIVLTNQSGLPRRDRLGKSTSRKRRLPQSWVIGRYHGARRGNRPWIELFVDNIVPALGKYKIIPLIREIVFGDVLFHEIGHHIEATLRPEFREKEDSADDWGKKLLGRFIRQKYKFLMPFRKQLVWALKFVAATH